MAKKDLVEVNRELLFYLKSLVSSVGFVLVPMRERLNTEMSALTEAIDVVEETNHVIDQAIQSEEER
jgi:hypothetical protein